VLARLDEVRKTVIAKQIDEVIIALPHTDQEKLNLVIGELQLLPVHVRVAPSYLEQALYRATVDDFHGIPLINLRALALSRFQLVRKRIFDFSVALVLTLLFLPVIVAIAIAIKLDSKGPILFVQMRAGTYGRPFVMYKFRSMYDEKEGTQAVVRSRDPQGNIVHKLPNDPRVTPVGQFLRRTSLDELPQLFNVLKGDMSLVGPRPEMPWLVDTYEPWQRQRFAIPQGMTGWWQINGRSEKTMHLNTEYDLYYIRNYSFLLDLQILWRTAGAVIKGRGAY
jgi:exopolysaccharide biosynthesis polyprenyl glycosylphosphotransferase